MKNCLFVIVTFLIASFGVLLSGCNNSTCSDNHSALPLMGFYNASDNKAITLDSIDFGGVGAPMDSLLVLSGKRTQQVYLPFRNGQSATSFFFHYDYKLQGLDNEEFNDTITFYYTASPFFASNECGAMYQYHIDRVEFTRHLIENVVVTDSMITNVERERIQVLFRVSEPENPENRDSLQEGTRR